MTLPLRVLEANDAVFIVGSGIPGGQYLSSSDLSSGAYIVPDLAADRSGLCSMFVKTIILPLIHIHVMMD